jgi:hypothetical protein
MDRTVEVIEKLTILVKNRALVVLLGQLVVDILILDRPWSSSLRLT